MGLLDQQGRGVAGDPPPEGVGATEARVEGEHRDRVRPTDPGGERRHRGAQHVHPRVAARHHRPARDRVLALWHVATAARLQDPGPEPPGGAQLGDLQELLVGDGVAELDQAGGLVDREAGAGEHAQVVHSDGHRPAELLDVARPLVVQRGAVHDRRQDTPLVGPPGDVHERLGPGRHRVGGQVAARRRGAVVGVQQVGERFRLRRTRSVQRDRRDVEQHPGQGSREVGALVETEQERGRAGLELGERGLVAGGGVVADDQRTDVPGAGPQRSAAGLQVTHEPRRAQRRDLDPVEGGAGQLLPDVAVGVVVAEPTGLAEHPGRG